MGDGPTAIVHWPELNQPLVLYHLAGPHGIHARTLLHGVCHYSTRMRLRSATNTESNHWISPLTTRPRLSLSTSQAMAK